MKGKTVKSELGLGANEPLPHPPPTFSTGNYKINFLSTAIICIPPIAVVIGALLGVPLVWKTVLVGIVFYVLNGLVGITAGYHRLYAHRAYQAHWLVELIVSFFGAGAFQGSVKWWCRNHRIHHRYIDTDKDPYNATRGFFYTHMGWMLMQQDYSILGRVDVSDFTSSWIVMAQHIHYLPIALTSGIILPTVICGFGWNDWWGGYFYAALAKMMMVHHCTFFINSIAHTNLFGASQNYSEQHSSHDSFVCAVLTFGEGYHNFHHEFANDYRNGIRWYHYDPTKWFIRGLEVVGLARGLVRTPDVIIERGNCNVRCNQLRRAMEKVEKRLRLLDNSTMTSVNWTWTDVRERIDRGERLVVIGQSVLDLTKKVPSRKGSAPASWYDAHPGGKKILDMYVGKDATEAFSGGVYKHSEAAVNLLAHLRVANLLKE